MAAKKDSRASDRERQAQHAYFSGQEDGIPAAKKPPLLSRSISPVTGVTVGLAFAAVVVAALALWPAKRQGPNMPPIPRPSPMAPKLMLSQQMFVMTPTVKRLKDIPEDAPFRVDFGTFTTLRRLLLGDLTTKPATPEDLARVVLETSPSAEYTYAPLQLMKRGGEFYLCGYTYGHIPDEVLRSSAARVAAFSPDAVSSAKRSTALSQPIRLVAIYSSVLGAQKGMPQQPVTFVSHPQRSKGNQKGAKPQETRWRVEGGRSYSSGVGSTQQNNKTYGDDPADGKLTQILIPLDGFGMNLSLQGSGDVAITRAEVVRLDAHAYDNWKPLPEKTLDPGSAGSFISASGAWSGGGGAFGGVSSVPPSGMNPRNSEGVVPAAPEP